MTRRTMIWLMRGALRYYLGLDSRARRGDREAHGDELAICRESGMYAEELARRAAEFLEHLEKPPRRGHVEQFAIVSDVALFEPASASGALLHGEDDDLPERSFD